MSNKLARAVVVALTAAGLVIVSAVASAAQTADTTAPVVRAEETIPLSEAFPDNAAARDHVFRARQLVLAPGARTEQINHAGRPSITYVTQGMVREHRTGASDPVLHSVGDATMDRGGVTHFWENAGATDAVLLVVEVLPRAAQ